MSTAEFTFHTPYEAAQAIQQESWGAHTLALLDALDTSEWEALEIQDVVTWLKAQRRTQDERRGLNFDRLLPSLAKPEPKLSTAKHAKSAKVY